MKRIIFLCFAWIPLAAFADFSVMRGPVQPACVGLLNQQHAPYPVTIAVDLEGCQRSSSIPHMARQEGNRIYFLYQASDGSATDGYFGYEVVGQAQNGIYVLHTFSQLPGAKEIYDALLFVNLTKQTIKMYIDSNKPINDNSTKMNLIGLLIGGDRCSGGIQSATVKNNILTVKKYPSINSVGQCDGANTLTIDLND